MKVDGSTLLPSFIVRGKVKGGKLFTDSHTFMATRRCKVSRTDFSFRQVKRKGALMEKIACRITRRVTQHHKKVEIFDHILKLSNCGVSLPW